MAYFLIQLIQLIQKIFLNKTKEKILEIKKKDKIENNIIIARDISQDVFFSKINEINSQLDIKVLVFYLSHSKLEKIRKFDNRIITNIYGDKINDKKFITEKIRHLLSIKDCYFNQRTVDFKKILENDYTEHTKPIKKCLNILLIGQSRVGKSSLCNSLLNKYEALESQAQESVTISINEYSNNYFHIYDTPGITKTENKNLGDTSQTIINWLKKKFKNVDDSMDDIHAIIFVLKYSSNLENAKPLLKYIYEENQNRNKKIPIIFIINERKTNPDESDSDCEEIDNFKLAAKSLKSIIDNDTIKLYSHYDDDEVTNDEEDHNIIRIDIRKEKEAAHKIFKKLSYYLRKNNPFSNDLFKKMEEIKQTFDKLNASLKDPNLTKNQNNQIKDKLKKNKELCKKIISEIGKENAFFNKIFTLDNILESSERNANLAIALCCLSTFFTSFSFIPYSDIPLVYVQQAFMILCIGYAYGFSINEIPFKQVIKSVLGITTIGGAGGAIETYAHSKVKTVGISMIENSIKKAEEKLVEESFKLTSKNILEKAGKTTTEKVLEKMAQEGGKKIQEKIFKNSVKEGGKKITEKITETVIEYGTGTITKNISEKIIKEGGEKVVKEMGKTLTTKAGEELSKMTTSQIMTEVATEIGKNMGKTGAVESAAEAGKIIPLIGHIIGGTISGGINLFSTLGMGWGVKKFFASLVCSNEGAGYILNQKKNIDDIFNYMENIKMNIKGNMEYITD